MAKISVRARTVDMLGRQQIAGIPTAIHELFKNAHDAYATRVRVDYFRQDRVFVLRDNGIGMTREDFEGNWLTLGTESKAQGTTNRARVPYKIPKLPRRNVLGEKGIGRLAIAAIGSQVLVLTRARRKGGLGELVISFVNWSVFEGPSVDLSEIEIPIQTLKGGSLPDAATVGGLVDQVSANVKSLKRKLGTDLSIRILDELTQFNVYPENIQDVLGTPSLRGNGYGTQFFICPTNAVLDSDIDEPGEDSAPDLQKYLLGFANTMAPRRSRIPLKAEFRDHLPDSQVFERIGEKIFFTPQEFRQADHHFEGRFDEFGNFSGKIRIYDQKTIQHTINWPEGGGEETACGSFNIRIAYLQGEQKNSLVAPEDYNSLREKLDRIGGLYIYRDGIRILPYGNSDFDFLEIERRRSKSAQDWFFSYRRIFGAVEITSRDNAGLVEKAGREGFISNKAYRQLRSILINFFKQTAIDFFRPSGSQAGTFIRRKDELKHAEAVLQERESRKREKLDRFRNDLDAFFAKVEDYEVERQAREIETSVEKKGHSIVQRRDSLDAGASLLRVEENARREITKLRNSIDIKRPSGMGLSPDLRADWDSYRENKHKLDKDVFRPLMRRVGKEIGEYIARAEAPIDQKLRIDTNVKLTANRTSDEAARLQRIAIAEGNKLRSEVIDRSRFHLEELTKEIAIVLDELSKIPKRQFERESGQQIQDRFQRKIETIADREISALQDIVQQIQHIVEAAQVGASISEETEVIEEKLERLQVERDTYADLAQVGNAIGIIQHEFSSTISNIRKNIRQLRPWAAATPDLQPLYKDLRATFDHLEGYLMLFTPLDRRIHRRKVPISGKEIRSYILRIFEDRLERYGIELVATRRFMRKSVKMYTSTLFPCFVNIVDNAIYWVSITKADTGRTITLDADRRGFTISNTGPGIERRDAERIFEMRFSRKRGGQGMGLHIARQALAREGWELILENPGKGNEPSFRLSREPEYEENGRESDLGDIE